MKSQQKHEKLAELVSVVRRAENMLGYCEHEFRSGVVEAEEFQRCVRVRDAAVAELEAFLKVL